MKIELDIKENKAPFVMELLKQFSFVKVKQVKKPLKRSKEALKDDIKNALQEVKKIQEGKSKGRPAEELLNEL